MSTLTEAQVEQAARQLVAARRDGRPGPRMPPSWRPNDPDAALAIQRRVQALLGVSIGGWKCSLPTAERPVAYAAIFAPAIFRSSPCPVVARDGAARIEPEIAFVLSRDLPPRATAYTEAEVRAALGETRLVLELLASRYEDPAQVAFPELLADHVSNYGLFVGPAIGSASGPLERLAIAVEARGSVLHRRDGRHPDGHPLRPLVWLAGFFATRGDGLRAGEIVTTGSYAGALEVPVATPLRIEFGDLGAIEVELAAA